MWARFDDTSGLKTVVPAQAGTQVFTAILKARSIVAPESAIYRRP